MPFRTLYQGHRLPINWPTFFLMAMLLIVSRGEYSKWKDERADARQWMAATVEVVHNPEGGDPYLFYRASPTRPLDAVWSATAYSESDVALFTRKGRGRYVPTSEGPVLRSWQWFFEGFGTVPSEPSVPYYICVSYRMTTIDTGVTGDSSTFCSETHDPTQHWSAE